MCEVCVESHLGTSVPDPSEIAEILNLKTLQLQISHNFHNPALYTSREKDASEKQMKVNQKRGTRITVSVNRAAVGQQMNAFLQKPDLLCAKSYLSI